MVTASTKSPTETTTAPPDPDYELICPISYDVMRNPVRAADNQVYEKENIESWMKECQARSLTFRSPLTNEAMKNNILVDLPKLADRAEAWRRYHLKEYNLFRSRPELDTLSSEFFIELDSFKSLDLVRTLGLRSPSIICLGSESVGKSTLLERLVGFPILPRDQNVCTRMAIRVSLRRGPPKLSTLSVWNRKEDGTWEVSEGTEKEIGLQRLCEEIREAMSKAVGDKQYVGDAELRAVIQMPYCPNLDILDLPGFILTSPGRELTTQIAKRVIEEEKDYATFLLVHEATSCAHQSLAISLIDEYNLHESTLGVWTKLDRLAAPDDDTSVSGMINDMFANPSSGAEKLQKHGWVGVASRVSPKEVAKVEGCREVFRLHHICDVEDKCVKAWAKSSDLSDEVKARLGIGQVRQIVQKHFEQYLMDTWAPKIRERLTDHFLKLDLENCNLGLPIPSDPSYLTPLSQIREDATKVIGSTYLVEKLETHADSTFRGVLSQRLNALFRSSDDIMGLGNMKEKIKALEDLAKTVPDNPDFSGKTPYLEGAKRAYEFRGKMVKQSKDLINDLAKLGEKKGDIINSVCNILFKEPEVEKPQKNWWESTWTKLGLKSFTQAVSRGGNFEKLDGDDQAKLANLARFPGLKDDYKQYLVKCLTVATKSFQKAASNLLEKEGISDTLGPAILMHERAEGLNGALYIRNPSMARGLGDALMQLWVFEVLFKLEELTLEWDASLSLKEECCKDRLRVLKEMAEVCRVLNALSQLEAKVRKTN